jgi:ribosomal protein L11 methyltransferase
MFQLHIEHGLRDEIEALSDALDATGAVSVTLTDQFDDPILEPEPGATPLWPTVVIQALYTHETDAMNAQNQLVASYPHLSHTVSPLPEQDWERVCLDQFEPKQFGERLWVCPSWHTPPNPNAVTLMLDPGLAFGTGSHETTSLCLSWLSDADLTQKTIIDYGCGSGILAIAALKLGASHAFAVDIDEQALIATQDNATQNAILDQQITIGSPNELSNPVDVVIANILLAPLLTLKHQFHALLKDAGTLVVSGLLADQCPILIEAYQDKFLSVSTTLENGWGLVVFKKVAD